MVKSGGDKTDMKISLTEGQTLEAMRSFLLAILPSGVEVIAGQDNLVAEPLTGDFVTMLPITQHRIMMNETGFRDCCFTGSVAGTTLTVTDATFGDIEVGNQLFGPSIAADTIITEILTTNTYKLSVSQTVTSQKLAAGLRDDLSPKEVTLQLDVHGDGSSENSTVIEGLLRSSYAANYFSRLAYDVTPLYCTEPRQSVFNNAEQQSEKRWMIDCTLQCNPIITVPQEFADALNITTLEGVIL